MKINSKMYINFHIIPLSQNVRNTVILILYQILSNPSLYGKNQVYKVKMTVF